MARSPNKDKVFSFLQAVCLFPFSFFAVPLSLSRTHCLNSSNSCIHSLTYSHTLSHSLSLTVNVCLFPFVPVWCHFIFFLFVTLSHSLSLSLSLSLSNQPFYLPRKEALKLTHTFSFKTILVIPSACRSVALSNIKPLCNSIKSSKLNHLLLKKSNYL